jgi:hypothetical protein
MLRICGELLPGSKGNEKAIALTMTPFTRLRLIAPVIKDHGIDYERGKFQDKLNDGSLTLERTQRLIESIIKKGVTLGRFAMHDLVAGNPAAYVRVHTTALIELITVDAFDHRDVPETLLMDARRLESMHRQYRGLVGNITIALTATQGLTTGKDRDVKREEKKHMLRKLCDFLAIDATFDIEVILVEVGDRFDEIGIYAGDDLR